MSQNPVSNKPSQNAYHGNESPLEKQSNQVKNTQKSQIFSVPKISNRNKSQATHVSNTPTFNTYDSRADSSKSEQVVFNTPSTNNKPSRQSSLFQQNPTNLFINSNIIKQTATQDVDNGPDDIPNELFENDNWVDLDDEEIPSSQKELRGLFDDDDDEEIAPSQPLKRYKVLF